MNLVGLTFRPWASFMILSKLTFRRPRSMPTNQLDV